MQEACRLVHAVLRHVATVSFAMLDESDIREVSVEAIGWVIDHDDINDLPDVQVDDVLACAGVQQRAAAIVQEHCQRAAVIYSLHKGAN